MWQTLPPVRGGSVIHHRNVRCGPPSSISYGSRHDCAAMPMEGRSHQLGKGQLSTTGMSGVVHPSRLVYESQGSNAEMPMRYRSQGEGQLSTTGMSGVVRPSPPVYGSLCYHAAMPIYDRSHLFKRGQTPVAEMLFENRLSREGLSWPRRNAIHGSPFPPVLGHVSIAEMPHLPRPILTRGQQRAAEMPSNSRLAREGSHDLHTVVSFSAHPSQPVYGSHLVNTAMLMNDRSHQFWANPSTQKCREVDAHQLGKDIICTLIKPLLFLPFLLIYGSRYRYAAMSFRGRSHQIWAIRSSQQCYVIDAQYNQRPSTTRSNATT